MARLEIKFCCGCGQQECENSKVLVLEGLPMPLLQQAAAGALKELELPASRGSNILDALRSLFGDLDEDEDEDDDDDDDDEEKVTTAGETASSLEELAEGEKQE